MNSNACNCQQIKSIMSLTNGATPPGTAQRTDTVIWSKLERLRQLIEFFEDWISRRDKLVAYAENGRPLPPTTEEQLATQATVEELDCEIGDLIKELKKEMAILCVPNIVSSAQTNHFETHLKDLEDRYLECMAL
jgi:hypothetical protein